MEKAKTGDTVKVHYRGELLDGTVFDSSNGREPLEFKIGEGNVIPGFEEAVIDMCPGDSKTATIPPDQAYGPHEEEMLIDVPRETVPPEIPLDIGTELQMRAPDGRTAEVKIAKVTDDTVTLDANHPLAGKDLVFHIDLVSIG
jgi:FKBP-type peptidyl-prolyl cis-trans isomerase 2